MPSLQDYLKNDNLTLRARSSSITPFGITQYATMVNSPTFPKSNACDCRIHTSQISEKIRRNQDGAGDVPTTFKQYRTFPKISKDLQM